MLLVYYWTYEKKNTVNNKQITRMDESFFLPRWTERKNNWTKALEQTTDQTNDSPSFWFQPHIHIYIQIISTMNRMFQSFPIWSVSWLDGYIYGCEFPGLSLIYFFSISMYACMFVCSINDAFKVKSSIRKYKKWTEKKL